jgi:hypothetical protein
MKDDIQRWSSILYKAVQQAVQNGYHGTYNNMSIAHCFAAIDVSIDDEPFFYNIIFEPEFARYITKKNIVGCLDGYTVWQSYLMHMSIQLTYEDKFLYLEQFITK